MSIGTMGPPIANGHRWADDLRMPDKSQRPRQLAVELRGFAGRLQYALRVRLGEQPELTQNRVAESAGVNPGNFSKLLRDQKTEGVTANTILLLARALRVRPAWLLTGEEPSGLDEARSLTPVPLSSQRPRASSKS